MKLCTCTHWSSPTYSVNWNTCRNSCVAVERNWQAMALDSTITSPHRRSQPQTAFSSSSPKKQYSRSDELGSCSTLFQRHRFLLTALALLTFLCTIYLYFAVTLGASDSCSELSGAQKASCHLQQAKASVAKGKLKFF